MYKWILDRKQLLQIVDRIIYSIAGPSDLVDQDASCSTRQLSRRIPTTASHATYQLTRALVNV